MNKIFSPYLTVITMSLLFFFTSVFNSVDARTPAAELPSSILFGGITIKFDPIAQKLLKDNVRSLMANEKLWEEKMERAVLFFPIVENILVNEQVPADFKYLALQQSSFKPDLVSFSDAAGFWQFKPETARQFNLRVDKVVDERKNISSSTHAAASCLKKHNQEAKNWVSALFSYYQEQAGSRKSAPAAWTGASEITLNGRTDRLVIRFFAHKIAYESSSEKYSEANLLALVESAYGKGETFAQISRKLQIPQKDLRRYNRWVTGNRIPTDKAYMLTLPVETRMDSSVRAKLSAPVPTVSSASQVFADNSSRFPILKNSDAVSPTDDLNIHLFFEINGLPGIEAITGDDAKSIAKAAGIRMQRFLRSNDMSVGMPIIPENIYYLRLKHKKAPVPFHAVKTGDNWHRISQQYGIRLVNLLKFNRTIFKNTPLQTGQVVWLNKKRPRRTPIELTTPEPADTTAINPMIAALPETQSRRTEDAEITLLERKKYASAPIDENYEPETETAPSDVAAGTETPTEQTKKPTGDKADLAAGELHGDDKGETKSTKKAKTVPGKTVSDSQSKNPFLTPSENASRMPANTLPAVPEKPVPGETISANTFHTVQDGQTFFSISRLYNLSVKELLTLNNLKKLVTLSIGQKLIVKKQPAPTTAVQTDHLAQSADLEPKEPVQATTSRSHIVAPGETVFRLSQIYQVSVEEIQSLNKLSDFLIKSGQRIKIPQK